MAFYGQDRSFVAFCFGGRVIYRTEHQSFRGSIIGVGLHHEAVVEVDEFTDPSITGWMPMKQWRRLPIADLERE